MKKTLRMWVLFAAWISGALFVFAAALTSLLSPDDVLAVAILKAVVIGAAFSVSGISALVAISFAGKKLDGPPRQMDRIRVVK